MCKVAAKAHRATWLKNRRGARRMFQQMGGRAYKSYRAPLAAWPRFPEEKWIPRRYQCPGSAVARYLSPSPRQTPPGSCTEINGWAPAGDMNVAKTSATPLVRLVAL